LIIVIILGEEYLKDRNKSEDIKGYSQILLTVRIFLDLNNAINSGRMDA
jgi:hypothetical protein